jgi:L,D-peptidoglycan transpeptidase YkuD (ErfK/YbiS/YcfS/YnhG family)
VTRRHQRRAPAIWRPLFFTLAVLSMGGVVLFMVQKAALRTAEEIAVARSLALAALNRLGDRGVASAKDLRAIIAAAEEATESATGSPPWSAARLQARRAWAQALNASCHGLSNLRQERLWNRQQWDMLETAALRAILRADHQSTAPGLARREAMLTERAKLKLDQARALAGHGSFAAANELATSVLALTGDVEASWRALHERFFEDEALREWKESVSNGVEESLQSRGVLIVADKLRRELLVYVAGKLSIRCAIELGTDGLRRKLHSGDNATPEGEYRVIEKRDLGQTRFHKALMLDYPNDEDHQRHAAARRNGEVPRGLGPGSQIEIHGEGGKGWDWTDGCIALSDADMDRVFELAEVGSRVVVVGTVPPAPEVLP